MELLYIFLKAKLHDLFDSDVYSGLEFPGSAVRNWSD